MKNIGRIILLSGVTIATVLLLSYLLSGGKTEIFNQVQIQKPPEVVFDFISDMRNELNWNPDAAFIEKKTEGDIGIGSVFKAKWSLSDTIDVAITKYDRPFDVTFENGGQLEVKLILKLTAIDSTATKLESTFIATPHGFIRVIFPFFKRQLKSQESINMQNLKNALERS